MTPFSFEEDNAYLSKYIFEDWVFCNDGFIRIVNKFLTKRFLERQ